MNRRLLALSAFILIFPGHELKPQTRPMKDIILRAYHTGIATRGHNSGTSFPQKMTIYTGPVSAASALNAYVIENGAGVEGIYKLNFASTPLPLTQSTSDRILDYSDTPDGMRDLWLDEQGSTTHLYMARDINGTNIGKIQRINTDGTGLIDIITGIDQIRGMAYDAGANMIYWFDQQDDLLYRADISAVISSANAIAQNASVVESISISTVNGIGKNVRDIDIEISGNDISIYAIATNTNEAIFKTTISRTATNALTNATWTELVTGLTLGNDMALDLTNGFLYFADDQGAAVGNLYRIATNASTTAVSALTPYLTGPVAGDVLSMDVDVSGGNVYWLVNTSGSEVLYRGDLASVAGTTAVIIQRSGALLDNVTDFELEANNSVGTGVSVPTSATVAATVFLEGAYNGTSLNTTLNSSIPMAQPYSGSSFNNHAGTENASAPANAVDWVLIELREAGSAAIALNSTKVGSAAGFLMNDGSIKATDGTSNLTISLSGNSGANFYVVIYHRNHLPIMSASAISESGGSFTIDFTSASANTFQTTTALVSLSGGKFGMPAGDSSGDGSIDNTDLSSWSTNNGAVFSYGSNGGSDFNLDGVINAVDRNDFQQKNTSKTRQVPTSSL